VIARLIEKYKATTTVAASTAFTALLNDPVALKSNFKSFKKVYSGGAPISPATIESFEREFGIYVHPVYGLTGEVCNGKFTGVESTGQTHAIPLYKRAPIDPVSGAVSVGYPFVGTTVCFLFIF
jgi:long-chain acyl-CoA synthetase